MTEPAHNYTGCGWEGKTYDRNLGIKDIAKIVRKQLKQEFPACKFSIRIQHYSGGQSLHIDLMEAPFEAILKQGSIIDNEFVSTEDQGYKETKGYTQLNQYAFQDPYDDIRPKGVSVPGWNNGTQLSREAWDTMKKVYEIARGFNYDDSDGMIDYFNTNFYLHLNIGKWDKPFKNTA